MFGNGSGASVSSRAMNFGSRSPGEIALMPMRILFVGLTVVLFFAWLTSADREGRASRFAEADCASFGRGGAHCAGASLGDSGLADPHDCINAARGGLICDTLVK